jgi:hypothetical protein
VTIRIAIEVSGEVFDPSAGCGMLLPARLSEGYRTFIETRLPLERSRYERLAASG